MRSIFIPYHSVILKLYYIYLIICQIILFNCFKSLLYTFIMSIYYILQSVHRTQVMGEPSSEPVLSSSVSVRTPSLVGR